MRSLAAIAATAPASAPSSSATRAVVGEDGSTRSTLGEAVNAAIDNFLAFGARVTELPLWMLLVAGLLIGAALFAANRRLARAGRDRLAARLGFAIRVAGVLLVALLVDRKLSNLQTEVNALRAKLSSDVVAQLGKKDEADGFARPFLFDAIEVRRALAANFKDVTLRPTVYDSATDVIQVRIGDPLVQAYLAIVDLSKPSVEIKLGTNLQRKTMTSAFAKENDCSLAINGEAGSSPEMNSGLGVWRGNMIYDGRVVSREDPKYPRPFLAFDARNRGAFTPAAATDRTLPADKPILIWGRLDSITNGVVQTTDERYRQPRTAMGISRDGTRLYLLVVDGRQQRYSVGFTRAEVGYLLKAFGADNAMLCDEGGSSCMYLKAFGGIVNSPSDNQGQERPTYTHFGIAVRDKP